MKKIIIANLCLLLSIYVAPAAELCTASSITNFKFKSAGIFSAKINGQDVTTEFITMRSNTPDAGGNVNPSYKSRIYTKNITPSYNGQYCYLRMISPVVSDWAYVSTPSEKSGCGGYRALAPLNFTGDSATKGFTSEDMKSIMQTFSNDYIAQLKGTTCPAGYRLTSVPFATAADTCDSSTQISLGTVANCSSDSTTDRACSDFSPTNTYNATTPYEDASGSFKYSANCYVFE